MDVVSTPPPRSPTDFFGVSHFTWAPKKPLRQRKPASERQASRSLDFSVIPVEGQTSESKTNFEKLTTQGMPARAQTPELERSLLTPGRPHEVSLIRGHRTAARRIDFGAITGGENEVNAFPGVIPMDSRTTSSGFSAKIQLGAAKRQTVASAGNTTSEKRLHSGKSPSSVKKARLTRLMR